MIHDRPAVCSDNFLGWRRLKPEPGNAAHQRPLLRLLCCCWLHFPRPVGQADLCLIPSFAHAPSGGSRWPSLSRLVARYFSRSLCGGAMIGTCSTICKSKPWNTAESVFFGLLVRTRMR